MCGEGGITMGGTARWAGRGDGGIGGGAPPTRSSYISPSSSSPSSSAATVGITLVVGVKRLALCTCMVSYGGRE